MDETKRFGDILSPEFKKHISEFFEIPGINAKYLVADEVYKEADSPYKIEVLNGVYTVAEELNDGPFDRMAKIIGKDKTYEWFKKFHEFVHNELTCYILEDGNNLEPGFCKQLVIFPNYLVSEIVD